MNVFRIGNVTYSFLTLFHATVFTTKSTLNLRFVIGAYIFVYTLSFRPNNQHIRNDLIVSVQTDLNMHSLCTLKIAACGILYSC